MYDGVVITKGAPKKGLVQTWQEQFAVVSWLQCNTTYRSLHTVHDLQPFTQHTKEEEKNVSLGEMITMAVV